MLERLRTTIKLSLIATLGTSFAIGGCTTGPSNGTAVDGPVFGKALTFSGYYNEPGVNIRLDVMDNPTLDPGDEESWAPFANATTSSTATYINSTDPLYSWSVTAAPVDEASEQPRWPQGGLVRLRAVHPDADNSFQLVTFDSVTFGDCLSEKLAANEDWTTIGLDCAGLGGKTAAIVSTTNIPVPPGSEASFSPDGFLGRKGEISVAETIQYYTATAAPLTLAAFKSKYGFPTGEVTATYYNDGDLGLGREMHCKTFLGQTFLLGVACYVTNYSGAHNAAGTGIAAFNVDPNLALADAVARQHAFATVAMAYDPSVATNTVKFVVYDAAGNRANTAQLDSTANNTSIPNNCLACHGISSQYSASGNSVSSAAKFLPFDPYSFKFSTAAGFTFADQADEIRRLNAMIKLTSPTPAIAEFIDGMYAPKAVTDPTAVSNDDFVPNDWALANNSLAGTTLYRGVVKVACRTCHMSATNTSLDFADYSDFSAIISTIKTDVCGQPHVMPHAERVMKNFWKSGARAYLVTGFPPATFPDPHGACKP